MRITMGTGAAQTVPDSCVDEQTLKESKAFVNSRRLRARWWTFPESGSRSGTLAPVPERGNDMLISGDGACIIANTVCFVG